MKDKIIVKYCMGCGKIKYLHDREWKMPPKMDYQSLDYCDLSYVYCEPCGERVKLEAREEMERLKNVKKS